MPQDACNQLSPPSFYILVLRCNVLHLDTLAARCDMTIYGHLHTEEFILIDETPVQTTHVW